MSKKLATEAAKVAAPVTALASAQDFIAKKHPLLSQLKSALATATSISTTNASSLKASLTAMRTNAQELRSAVRAELRAALKQADDGAEVSDDYSDAATILNQISDLADQALDQIDPDHSDDSAGGPPMPAAPAAAPVAEAEAEATAAADPEAAAATASDGLPTTQEPKVDGDPAGPEQDDRPAETPSMVPVAPGDRTEQEAEGWGKAEDNWTAAQKAAARAAAVKAAEAVAKRGSLRKAFAGKTAEDLSDVIETVVNGLNQVIDAISDASGDNSDQVTIDDNGVQQDDPSNDQMVDDGQTTGATDENPLTAALAAILAEDEAAGKEASADPFKQNTGKDPLAGLRLNAAAAPAPKAATPAPTAAAPAAPKPATPTASQRVAARKAEAAKNDDDMLRAIADSLR